MSLEQEYIELLKEESFLKTFPFFTGVWEEDKDSFTKMSDADTFTLVKDNYEIEEEDDFYMTDDFGDYAL